MVAGEDECDDGNRLSGDGCSSSGMVEWGWECFVNPNPGDQYLCVRVSEVHDWDNYYAITCGYFVYFFILVSMVWSMVGGG